MDFSLFFFWDLEAELYYHLAFILVLLELFQ